MFGLKHCSYYDCIMNSVTSGEEARQRKEVLCGICLKKLKFNIDFDLLARQNDLIKMCEQLDFKSEAKSHQTLLKKANENY